MEQRHNKYEGNGYATGALESVGSAVDEESRDKNFYTRTDVFDKCIDIKKRFDDMKTELEELRDIFKLISCKNPFEFIKTVNQLKTEYRCLADTFDEILELFKEFRGPLYNLPPEADWLTFPVRVESISQNYKEQRKEWWFNKETFSNDKRDWDKMSPSKQRLFLPAFTYFIHAEKMVSKAISGMLQTEIPLHEVVASYAVQNAMEHTHSEVYSDMIKGILPNPEEQNRIFNPEVIPAPVKLKQDWMNLYVNRKELSFLERIVALVCVEGLFFSSSFAFIFWLSVYNQMASITTTNNFIARDENLHVKNGVEVYNAHVDEEKLDPSEVKRIILSAVDVEKKFAGLIMEEDFEGGMNIDNMSLYIEVQADYLLNLFGIEPHFGSKNPFNFIDKQQCMVNVVNNFETHATYSIHGQAAIDISEAVRSGSRK